MDATTTADTYLAMWNEEDEARRAEIIADAWVADGRYLDPQLEAAGHDGLSTMVAAVHERFPGFRFRRTSAVDVHHDQIRFGWELVGPDGSVALGGLDVGEIDGDGKLRRITGFFGELAAA